MIIRSEDGKTLIKIESNGQDDRFSSFLFTIQNVDEVSPFSGRNDNVVFTGYADFLKSFQSLVLSREGNPVLKMSEDCFIAFFRWNEVGDIGVKASITKFGFSTDTTRSNSCRLEVEFKIDGEYVNSLFEDFKQFNAWE